MEAVAGVRRDAFNWRCAAVTLLMLVSGFAGLGYQVVWTQQCALWLGHEAAAVLAVVAAFFGGLAVGAWLSGERVDRSSRPADWYVGAELVIAVWSAVLTFVMQPVSSAILQLTGNQPSGLWQWSVAFTSTFLLLLPATAAMGVTLPAMERITHQWHVKARSIAPLYAANTLGAVIGVMAIAFWLAPTLGFVNTARVCSALNASCAVMAWWLYVAEAPPVKLHPPSSSISAIPLLSQFLITGLLGIGYEVLVVRVLSQINENTIYTFALLLAVYLVGSAGGAAAYQYFGLRQREPRALTGKLYAALAIACAIGTLALMFAAAVRQALIHGFGSGLFVALLAEASTAGLAFAPATFLMGLVFSHLSAQGLAKEISFGRMLACNTLGATLAPMLFGVLLLPVLGAKTSLLLVCGGYVLLALVQSRNSRLAWVAVFAVATIFVCVSPLRLVDVPAGGRIVRYQEGAMAAVSVVADEQGVLSLRIDNRQQEGSSVTQRVDGRQAWLPLMLHPHPRRALFLGLGTGVTALSATMDPNVRVDAAELLSEVIDVSEEFEQSVATGADRNRLRAFAADARRFVRTSSDQYDLIVADNFHPARSGAGSLYTVEHFRAIAERLAPEGLFCQWLPLHQLDIGTLRSIIRSFQIIYPQGLALLASNSLQTPVIGLVGRKDGAKFDIDALRSRLAQLDATVVKRQAGIDSELALLGNLIADASALRRFADTAPLNTDDHPVVMYSAPGITYSPDSLPQERLLALLHELTIAPDAVIDPSRDQSLAWRLAAYWQARDRYLEIGAKVRVTADLHDTLRQLREPLLAVLRISPDFAPAYEPLRNMANALAQSDPQQAAELNSAIELARAPNASINNHQSMRQ